MPGTALGRLDGELHVLTQALAGHTRVHAQLVHDLQTLGAGVLQRAELDILHVELALQHVAVGGDRIRVLDHHGQLGERLAHANLLGLTHGKRAGNNLTHLLHRVH